ncbi:MAG: SGNH/GDSL hydrolase family protein [Thiomicrorhabdus sp.]|nr:SGNH/GDSL hydrolase family protein [Thiomicrorhabdus sp.]
MKGRLLLATRDKTISAILGLIVVLLLLVGCEQPGEALFASCDFSMNQPEGFNSSTWVVVGSSTAVGAGASSYEYSVMGLLSAELAKSSISLVNIAQGGLVSYQVLPDECVLPASRLSFSIVNGANLSAALEYRPELIIVSLPSNDMAVGFSDTEILNNFEQMHRYSIATGIPILFLGFQPRAYEDERWRRVEQLNAVLAERYDECWVDVLSLLSGQNGMLDAEFNYDGVHLNNSGHKILYDAILNYIDGNRIMNCRRI